MKFNCNYGINIIQFSKFIVLGVLSIFLCVVLNAILKWQIFSPSCTFKTLPWFSTTPFFLFFRFFPLTHHSFPLTAGFRARRSLCSELSPILMKSPQKVATNDLAVSSCTPNLCITVRCMSN